VVHTDGQNYTGRVVASQNVFRGFRSINEFRQAQARVRAGRAGLHSVEQSVFLDAVTSFLDVIRDEAVVRLRQNNVAVLERQLEASQDRFDLGDATRTDVAQSEARLSLARSNLTAAEAQLTASRAAFERVVGTAPSALTAPEALPDLPANEDDAVQRALDNNPALQAAIETEVASRRAVDIAVGTLLPSARVDATLQHSEDDDNLQTQSDSQTISGTVTIPLYQSGAEYSAIRAARQTNNADRIRIAEAERQIREAVAVAWDALLSTQSVITSSQEQVRANEIAFEGVQQEAQVGSRTTLDVLNAEQELLDSRVTLVRAQRDEQVAAYQLLAAVGDLTAEDLGLPVDYYDPARHYRRVWWLPIGWGAGQ
jgi:outer membrane protein